MGGTKYTRRKADIVLPAGWELFWQIIRKLNAQGSWTIPDVAAFAGAPAPSVQRFVYGLEKGGFVRRLGHTERVKGVCSVLYEVAIDRQTAPRLDKDGAELPERLTDLLWRTMRMMKRFTIKELAAHIADQDRAVSVAVIRTYVVRLVAAGILVHDGIVRRSEWQPYRIAKALGPQGPRVLQADVVFDPNASVMVGAAVSREMVP